MTEEETHVVAGSEAGRSERRGRRSPASPGGGFCLPPRPRRAVAFLAGYPFINPYKLQKLPAMRRILGQCEHGIDLREIMDEGQIAIFNLAKAGAHITEDIQRLLGTLLLQDIRCVTMQRRPNESLPFYLLIDEFGFFVSNDIMQVFTEAAKFGLRAVLAHQGLSQLLLDERDPKLHDAVMSIEQKVVFGGSTVEDQLLLARQLYGPWLDLDKRKLELWTRSFEPVLKKAILASGSRTVTDSDGESSGRTRSLDPELEELG